MRCWIMVANPIENSPQFEGGIRLERAVPRGQVELEARAQPAPTRNLGTNKPKLVYLSKEGVMEAASEYAKTHPQVPVYIFESTEVVETAEPSLINKQFNNSGELLPT